MNQPPEREHTLSPAETDPLTPGERQAWQLAQLGLSTRAISHALNLSRSTIRSRLSNAQRKLAGKEHAA